MQERRTVTALTGREAGATSSPAPAGRGRRLAVAAGVALAVVGLDQLTKSWALDRLSKGSIHVVGPLDLELTRNSGASFSLFQGRSFVLTLVALVLVTVLAAMLWRAPTTGRAVALGLVLGGALGNLADRLFRGEHGAVIDFVALHVWPTFNVADASVVVGCALLLLTMVRDRR